MEDTSNTLKLDGPVDKQIEKLAKQAGYRIAAIRRDREAMGG